MERPDSILSGSIRSFHESSPDRVSGTRYPTKDHDTSDLDFSKSLNPELPNNSLYFPEEKCGVTDTLCTL